MQENSVFYRGWIVVFACFAMTSVGFGFGFYGHSVYLAALTIDNGGEGPGLAIATVSTAVTVYYLASAAIMVFISDLIAKWGPRLFATVGAVTMGISLYLISNTRTVLDVFFAYLAMAPAFAMLTNAAVANIIAPWFVHKRGLAMSLALAGGAVGGFVIVPTLVWLSGQLTFSAALQTISTITIPLLLVAILFCIRNPTATEVGVINAGNRGTETVNSMTRRQALGSAHYWTIAAPLMLAIMVQFGFVVHQVSFLFPMLGGEGAGVAVFLTASMAALSRVVVGFFIDRLDQRLLGATLLVAQACSLFAMLYFATPIAAFVGSAVFGFAVGVMITLPTLLIQRECPAASFGMLSGLTLAVIQTGNAFGPSIVGWLHDMTGNYTLPIAVCIALQIIAIAILSIRIGAAANRSHR
ncbi:MAG: MFS transporter [Pseudomonadota bacterium]